MKKLWLLVVLALCFVLPCAAEEEPTYFSNVHFVGTFEYRLLEDGTAEIIRYKGDTKWLTVPSKLDGHPVTSIATAAFVENSDLISIKFPEGITSIDKTAVYLCTKLRSITLPASVTSIGKTPFYGCNWIATIEISPDNPVFACIDGVLFRKTDKTLLRYPPEKDGEHYEIPNGIVAIDDEAFAGANITTIVIPESVTSIGKGAFWGSELTEVTIPDGVTEIPSKTFSACRSLSNVSFPKQLVSIGEKAFEGCYVLDQIILPDTLVSIGSHAFDHCYELSGITIPDNVIEVGDALFNFCSALTDIRVSPEHPVYEVIDGVLFNKVEKKLIYYPYSSSAESYTIPEGTLAIGNAAFYKCKNLKEIIFPAGLQEIGEEAFYQCTGLTNLDLPEGLRRLGIMAFYNCHNIKTAVMPASIEAIGGSAFPERSSCTFTVERDSYAAQWCKDNKYNHIYPDANDWLLN